jgi:hypothetical protein
VLQESQHACNTADLNRVPLAAIPVPERLRHIQTSLYHVVVARCETGTFTRTSFSPLLDTPELRTQATQDCMRMHASMWAAAAVSKGALLAAASCPCGSWSDRTEARVSTRTGIGRLRDTSWNLSH